MLETIAIRCRKPDVGLMRNALANTANITEMEPDQITTLEKAPDIVFVGWDTETSGWTARNQLTMMVDVLHKVRRVLAFRDVPVLLVVSEKDAHEASAGLRYGATGLLTTPLEEGKVVQTVKDAMTPAGSQSKIDVRMINPFVESTVEVLRTMAQTEASRKEVLLKKDYRMFGDISAVIGIMGDTVEGAVAITFHEELAREIVARMVGTTPDNLTPDEVHDGLGELVNMVAGNAKTALSNADVLKFNLALPTIVSGIGHEIAHRPGTPCLVIVFDTQTKPFAVQVAICTDPNK